MTSSPIRIATRASQLALWQANYVADRLRELAPERRVELVEVSTIGDRDRVQPLNAVGSTGVFTREVQRAVLDDSADIAVHSLKDLPTDVVDGLSLAGIPERASRFDALILPAGSQEPGNDAAAVLRSLPSGAKIGTGSLRRQAQLLHFRSDFTVENIRGNVETRLRKLDDGEFTAIVLAEAGLQRLGLGDRISVRLAPPLLLPAVGQGALGLECRTDDETTRELLQQLDDAATRAAVTTERALLSALRAGCHAPVGVDTAVQGGTLIMTAIVLSPDGAERLESLQTGPANTAEEIGRDAAADLQSKGAARLMGHE